MAEFVSNSGKCENETPSQDFDFSTDSVAKAIDQLKQTLNQNYLRAEKSMALRRPNTDELNDVWSEIDQNYKELIETMKIVKVDCKVVATASKNKSEFELRKIEFLQFNSATSSSETPCFLLPPGFNLLSDHDVSSVFFSSLSAKSNKSSHSTASTISLKCLNAEIELQIAQLEAEQLNERLKEQTAKADLEAKLRELDAQAQVREAKRKIELAKKKREVLNEFSENCSVKSSRNVLSKHCKVSSEPLLSLTNSKKVSIGQYYPGGLPEGGVSSSSVSVPTMVSSSMPKVNIGRIIERPQSVEKPTSTLLSALAKAYEPTVSMGRNCPVNRPRVAEYPVSSALPLSVTQVPSYKHTMSDARQYVQNPQWAPEPRSLPEVTQMTSYQPLYQHQMTTSFEQQTSQVSCPVNSTANQFASCCLPSNSLRADVLATANSYGSPRISSQTYGNSAIVESLHPTLDFQRNARNSLPETADNLTFMPGQRTMCLPGRVNYDSMFLPRPEFPKFSGDPLQYRTFITNFETHVESRIKDPKMLFCLLTQHCVDAVRKRIQHLEGKGEQCYNLAKQRLKKEYGSSWIVSDVCEQKLKKFSSIKSGDAKQIKQFAELLEKSYNILVDINNFGILKSLDSLTALVIKLPYELRRRWVEKAVYIENSTGILAKFEHFVAFVQNESDKLNSLFGLRNLSVKVNKPEFKVNASFYSVSSNKPTLKKDTKSFLKTGVCWFCNDTSHKLLECKIFLSKSVKDRTSFVKSCKLCLKCLSARH